MTAPYKLPMTLKMILTATLCNTPRKEIRVRGILNISNGCTH